MSNGNIEVKLLDVRLSFPHLFSAQKSKDPNGKAKFNASFLLDKTTKQGKKNIKAMRAAIEEAKEEKWGDNPPKLKPSKVCLRDGDDEDWDGYEDHMYVSANNTRRPTVVDRRQRAVAEEDGLLYAGCYVNAIVRVWCQDNDHGKRVNASLEGVQYVREGEAFGAPALSEDAFDDLGDDEDDWDDWDDEDDEDEDDDEPPRRKKRKSRVEEDDDEDDDEPPRRKKKRRSRVEEDEDDDDEPPRRKKKRKKRREPDYDEDEDELI